MSFGEMVIIAVLVLVFFDADQIPELARKAGRLYGQVRGASDDLRRAFNAEVARVDADKRRAELERRRAEIQRLREQARVGEDAVDAPPRADPTAPPRPDGAPPRMEPVSPAPPAPPAGEPPTPGASAPTAPGAAEAPPVSPDLPPRDAA